MDKSTPTAEIPNRKYRDGSTIIEAIVAIAILAIFIAGATQVIMSQHQVTDKARAHYTAINIAKNQVEQVRNMRRADYNQIAAMIESDIVVNADGEPDDNGKFSRTTQISGTSTPDLLEVTVTVKIKNPITLQFGNENEHVTSYMAKLKDR